ncbi:MULTISPECIES: DUF2442 domain-containing protein [unclassified Mesotoga]|uniref:DUF2442 domain-containing protein n=1 Tax=unclassified Mesotoga TaxID=1184398 RepID=UPI000DA6A3A7|nr:MULTISPECIES: DUF2442 domain-containing protein [unclassified Mesotoga]PZC53073.1 hypothetical protein LH53_00950 [Mesotoga sp. TolDC]
MNIEVKSIKHCKPYEFILEFNNGEERAIDLEGILDKGRFAELRDPKIFCSARIAFDTIEWCNGLDICPEYLFEHSKPAPNIPD